MAAGGGGTGGGGGGMAEPVVLLKKSNELAPVITFVMKSTGTVVPGEYSARKLALPDLVATSSEPKNFGCRVPS